MTTPSSTDHYAQLRAKLETFIPEDRLIGDPLRRLAYGLDASFYRLVPRLVVDVADETEVIRLLGLAAEHRTPVTFRAAGTSLCGQAVTDSVLVRLGWGWRGHRMAADGSWIALQPGIIGSHANKLLARHRRKIGPDPASIDAARIGGIAANNASGMCCGTEQNSYQTLLSLRVVLADGTVLDTGDLASRSAFAASHGTMLAQLAALSRRVRADAALTERIRTKYRLKNTTGYSLNALIDFEDPFEILQHLLIGSEGTLGFISEITYRTVPDHPHKASALILFPDLRTACAAIVPLKALPVAAAELMDRASLRSVAGKPGMPAALKDLPPDAAAVLVETRAPDAPTLAVQVAAIEAAMAAAGPLAPAVFTDVPAEFARLWQIRKGLFPAVGAVRRTGTTVVIEDVAFDISRLADATLELQGLLKKHGYPEAIIFGHALAGNLHFVFTQDFGPAAEVARYRALMDDVCRMVVHGYDGSLKAEHGTGRNMAPFVELEWGRDAYELMKEIKALFDPAGLLNPGVILSDDPELHLRNLKPLAPADPLVDTCIECGFCEPTCPSRALTLTPRQRIIGLRELARLRTAGDQAALLAELEAAYQHQSIDTCAGDSLCSIACPVSIDTGKMIKGLRGRQAGPTAHWLAERAAKNFGTATAGTRLGLGTAGLAHAVVGTGVMSALTGWMRAVSGERLPPWTPYLPGAGRMPPRRPLQNGAGERPRVVYFPSCASRSMGPARGDPERETLPEKTEALLRKAGFDVVYPAQLHTLCCGTPFESKGFADTADAKGREAAAALAAASRDGRDPIVHDTSLCAHRLKSLSGTGIDIIAFLHDVVLDRLPVRRLPETVAIHTTCSAIKMGLADKLRAVAERCAEKVIVPDGIACCGWAGDKGFTVPELNASALRELKGQLPDECSAGYSTGRTCEIGLSAHSGRYYRSIVYLVDRCTQMPAG